MDILQAITQLSHEFGTDSYVRGGGGNSSCKDDQTLWVKPSGTTLGKLSPESFVSINRKQLWELYSIEPPSDSAGREAMVKEMMARAVLPGNTGRPSVEAPLHDSLNARFVVHTHPGGVNGMTCSKKAKAVAVELFPEALWLDYIDPGFTLCMQVRKEIINYKHANGREPEIILLKNHGVFVSADTPDEIRKLYGTIMARLDAEYQRAGITQSIEIKPLPKEEGIENAKQMIRSSMENPDLHISVSGSFDLSVGPISPDHIVYSKSYPFIGEPDIESIKEFKHKNGYLPQVLAFNGAVFGVAENSKSAELALELAIDGAIVEKLAGAFGGIDYLDDRSRDFIENWEVESYRKKQIGK